MTKQYVEVNYMSSALKQTKYYFDDMFSSNWTSTPIHFAGQEFDNNNIPSWINVSYTPVRSTATGLGNSNRTIGSVTVVCWDTNDVGVMELADEVIDFMKDNVEQNSYSLRGYDVDDHAWHTSNSVYIYLTFTVTTYFC